VTGVQVHSAVILACPIKRSPKINLKRENNNDLLGALDNVFGFQNSLAFEFKI
jgi:hypothetical protein